MRKKISIEEISQIIKDEENGPSKIIDDISNSRISLLRSFGCWQLNLIFFWVRIACRFFLNLAELRAKRFRNLKRQIALKNSLGTIFARGAPFVIDNPDAFPLLEKRDEGKFLDCGLIIGFNHPSLGEIIRLMAICMIQYDTKRYLFPVNIVWFEALAPVIDRLSEYGFTLMPVITPSAKQTMCKYCSDGKAMELVDSLAFGFTRAYIAQASQFVEEKQIVLVAPSARRKYHIFSNPDEQKGKKPIEPQTMTTLARCLLIQKLGFAILPVAVIPPRNCSRGLNLLKPYQFSPCDVVLPDDVQNLCKERDCQGICRRFERYFLERIAEMLKKYQANDMIIGTD